MAALRMGCITNVIRRQSAGRHCRWHPSERTGSTVPKENMGAKPTLALARIFQNFIQNCWRAQRAKLLPKSTAVLCGLACAGRENFAEICATTGFDRQQPGPPATTEGAVTRPATLPLAAYTTVDLSLVTRASVLHLMPCSQLGSWYFRHAQCTQWLSITRCAACLPLHSSMCVAPSVVACFVQSTALSYLTPCSQLLSASETREAEAQRK